MAPVIIPAYNEQNTIGGVVARFSGHYVIVVIDPDTTDQTALMARRALFSKRAPGNVVFSPLHGKGQCVEYGLKNLPKWGASQEIILCDADVQISPDAVMELSRPLYAKSGQRVIIPRMPALEEWRAAEKATNLSFSRYAWRFVSGIRRVRRHLIPDNLYGYLMETQINKSVAASDTPYSELIGSHDTISPFRWNAERVADLHAHGRYGKEHGIL